MCGIIGYIDSSRDINTSYIAKMQDILKHRGPDDKGEMFLNIATEAKGINCALGFVRLSIRDLSQNGHQPMNNSTNDITIIFNGEIYNADELKPLLIEKGYNFRGTSDTEVLLYLYEAFGIEKMLTMLDGMYAICIADKRIDKLFLIRDKIGEKPLYIYKKDSLLMFASEYKAFYCHPNFKPELYREHLQEYFMFRYIAGEETLLKGVTNLTPGSYLTVSREGIKKTVYWSIPEIIANTESFEENKIKFRALLEKSLKRRLISDVPLGLQLSGGVDSSYMAYLVSNLYPGRLETFGITFDDEIYSEEKYMDIVNNKFDFSPNKIKFDAESFLDSWNKCVWFFEAPMNHEGTLGLMYLNKIAKNKVTVLICGEGSDEGLGGYDRFAPTLYYLNHKAKYICSMFFSNLKSFLKGKALSSIRISDFFLSQTQYTSSRSCNFITGGTSADIKRVYKRRRALLKEAPGKGLRKYMNYEIKTYMQDILMRADKVSMASSIEVRVPFIMPELIEYEASIPDEYLVSGTTDKISKSTKKLIKDLCCDIYGEDFTYRKKCGFGMPIIEYFKQDKVANFVEQQLLPSIKKRNVINYDNVLYLWKHRNGSEKFSEYEIQEALWCALSFELWCQLYLDSKVVEA